MRSCCRDQPRDNFTDTTVVRLPADLRRPYSPMCMPGAGHGSHGAHGHPGHLSQVRGVPGCRGVHGRSSRHRMVLRKLDKICKEEAEAMRDDAFELHKELTQGLSAN
eukprot:gene5185-931_t